MASKKTGLDNFPFSVHLFANKKVKLLANDCGDAGVIIWLKILSYAYEHYGYYFDMNDPEEVDLFAVDICKCKPQQLLSVVSVCIKRRLFVKTVFDVHKVLTCEDMQDTYLHATTERRRKGSVVGIRKDYLHERLYGKQYKYMENLAIFHGNNTDVPWKTKDDTGNLPHSIVKDSIVEYSKVKESKEQPANNNFFLKEEIEETRHKAQGTSEQQPKSYSEVLTFFDSTLTKLSIDAGFISSSSQKFYNHYESTGWKVDEKPIEDWKARARYWIGKDLEKLKQGR
jgi:hypothetical protein